MAHPLNFTSLAAQKQAECRKDQSALVKRFDLLARLLISLLALAFALFLISTSTATAEAPSSDTPALRLHLVQSGDTLRRLAVQYDTTAEEIVAANNLPYPYALSVGQRLYVPIPASAKRTPEQAASKFYGWYLKEIEAGNRPLLSGLYRASPYLTESFKRAVDDLLVDSPNKSIDPFLCGREVPSRVTVDPAFASTLATRAIVRIGLDQAFTVTLVPDGQAWKISGVACAAD